MHLPSIFFDTLEADALNGDLGGTWGSCFCTPTTINPNQKERGQNCSEATLKNTLPEALCHTVVCTSAQSIHYLKGYWSRPFLCHYRIPFQRSLQAKASKKHHSSLCLPTWFFLWLQEMLLKCWWWHVHVSEMFEKRSVGYSGDPAVLEEMFPSPLQK